MGSTREDSSSFPLDRLSLWDNKLVGTVPSELGLLQQMEHLDLEDNELTGSLPVELFALTNLKRGYFRETLLTGTIPLDFCDIPGLTRLLVNCSNIACDCCEDGDDDCPAL